MMRLLSLVCFISALLVAAACTSTSVSGAAVSVAGYSTATAVPSRIGAQAPPSMIGVGEVYDPAITSVQFGLLGLELSPAIVELGSTGRLLLSFDVLDEDLREYRYDLTHCDRDWTPSQLLPIDYVDGFTEGDITEFNLSFNAITKYSHYELALPNQYVRYTKSGNYLLNVYDQQTNELVMRQRFCVYDPLLTPLVQQTRPGQISKDQTHHEFDAAVGLKDVRLDNPRRSLSLSVMQNGDWRTGIYNVEPRFERNEQLLWDYQDRIVFPALREWRSLDLRTLESSGGRVREINRFGNEISAYLFPDESRLNYPFETRIDLNGNFVLEDFDNRATFQAEYTNAIFTLKAPRDPDNRPVYLYGALTQYQLSEANQGVYNELTNGYAFRVALRQGFYDFAYVTSDDGVRPNWLPYEGSNFQTENEYQFLVYYRPYGARYDRIIGYESIQINR